MKHKFFLLAVVLSLTSLTVLFVLYHIQPRMTIGLVLLFAGVFILDALLFLIKSRVKRFGVTMKSLAVVLNAFVCLAVTIGLVANAELFCPRQDADAVNHLLSNHRMSKITIPTAKGTLSGWFVKTVNGKAPLVIFFNGNGQCTADICYWFDGSGYWNVYHGCNFLAIDYPGFGQSNGTPSDKAILKMALATYDYAISRSDVDNSKIIVEGYSLGTGAATYLASQRNVDGLILLAPYDNVLSLYNARLDIFHGPLKLLDTYHISSDIYAKTVKVKPLIFTSTNDQVIGYKLSENLAKQFPQKPDLYVFNQLSHTDYINNTNVKSYINSYVHEVLQ